MQGNIMFKNNKNKKTDYSCSTKSLTCINNIKDNKEKRNLYNMYTERTNFCMKRPQLNKLKSSNTDFSQKSNTYRKSKLFITNHKSEKKIDILLSNIKFNNIKKESRNKIDIKKKKSKIEIKNKCKTNSCKIEEKSKIINLLKSESIKELDNEGNEENNKNIDVINKSKKYIDLSLDINKKSNTERNQKIKLI